MTARGIRNKNPGNLEKASSPTWHGEVWPGTDERFCQFETLAHGCRAIMRTLCTYHKLHGLETVQDIVGRERYVELRAACRVGDWPRGRRTHSFR